MLASVYAFNSPAPSTTTCSSLQLNQSFLEAWEEAEFLIDNGAGGTEEIKIKNLYSIVGIKMDNIHENDKSVASVLSNLSSEGWELVEITGPNSNNDSTGIFCTRYILKRER